MKSEYGNNKVGRILILFAKKLTGHRRKLTGNILPKSVQVFFMPVCLKSVILAKQLIYEPINMDFGLL